MTDASLAQNIELFKANLFSSIHVPLGGWKPFRGHVKRCIACDGFFRNEDSASVNASHIWKVCDFQACGENKICYFIPAGFARRVIDERIDLFFGQTVYLAQFSYYRFASKCAHSSKQRGVSVAISLENIIYHFIALLP